MVTTFIRQWLSHLICCVIGLLLLSAVYHTLDPFLLATFLFSIGLPLATLLSGGSRWIVRGFTLSFSLYVLICGLSQFYTQSNFGQPVSSGDSYGFYQYIMENPPYYTRDSLYQLINAPHAIIVWQQVYRLCAAFGLKHGIYIGTLFNCFIMAGTATVTVRIGKEIFGDDNRRLRLIGTISAFCGIYWMLGTMLLRDGFVVFTNAVVFLFLIRVLRRPGLGRIFCAVVGLCGAIYFMEHLRSYTVPILIFFGFLAVIAWLVELRIGSKQIWLTVLTAICLAIFLPDIRVFIAQTYETVSALSLRYMRGTIAGSTESSLAVNLIIMQPLPIRLPLATFYLLINPIPLWMAFNSWPLRENHLFKSAHGILTVLIMPGAMIGVLEIAKRNAEKVRGTHLLNFLLLAFIFSLCGVALTSLESRHFAQFFPLLILLAVIPDMAQPRVRRWIAFTRVYWFGFIVLLHVAWICFRFL